MKNKSDVLKRQISICFEITSIITSFLYFKSLFLKEFTERVLAIVNIIIGISILTSGFSFRLIFQFKMIRY